MSHRFLRAVPDRDDARAHPELTERVNGHRILDDVDGDGVPDASRVPLARRHERASAAAHKRHERDSCGDSARRGRRQMSAIMSFQAPARGSEVRRTSGRHVPPRG